MICVCIWVYGGCLCAVCMLSTLAKRIKFNTNDLLAGDGDDCHHIINKCRLYVVGNDKNVVLGIQTDLSLNMLNVLCMLGFDVIDHTPKHFNEPIQKMNLE